MNSRVAYKMFMMLFNITLPQLSFPCLTFFTFHFFCLPSFTFPYLYLLSLTFPDLRMFYFAFPTFIYLHLSALTRPYLLLPSCAFSYILSPSFAFLCPPLPSFTFVYFHLSCSIFPPLLFSTFPRHNSFDWVHFSILIINLHNLFSPCTYTWSHTIHFTFILLP